MQIPESSLTYPSLQIQPGLLGQELSDGQATGKPTCEHVWARQIASGHSTNSSFAWHAAKVLKAHITLKDLL